jgi:phospholipase/lecithinase/hemolysin
MTRKLIVCLLVGVATFSFQSVFGQSFSGIVAFGDSLSDLGNTYNELGSDGSYALAGYNSYYYDVGRWSNGPVWVENLARLLRLPALQINDGTSLYGTDFAWGGSTSGSGYSYYDLLSNLQAQVSSYVQLLSTSGAHMPNVSRTLFTVWSGGNDVIYKVSRWHGGNSPAG